MENCRIKNITLTTKKEKMKDEILANTPLKEIETKTLLYYKTMNEIADFLDKAKAPIRIQKAHQYLEFYIDKESVAKLVEIALLDNFDKLGCFFGMDPSKNNKITVSILGVDKEGEILPEHKVVVGTAGVGSRVAVQGQDQWGPPYSGKSLSNYLTLATKEKTVKEFFEKPYPITS